MDIGLVGSGGREHAIAEALTKCPERDRLFVYGSSINIGIEQISQSYRVGLLSEIEPIVSFFQEKSVDYIVVGPELPLIHGVADALRAVNIPVVGPNQDQARLEGNKAFMRDLMEKYIGQGNPRWCVVKDIKEAQNFINEVGQAVIKPTGLTGGKGVQVMGVHLHSLEETIHIVGQLIQENGSVLLEERLVGEEFSRMAFISDGVIVPIPVAQDFKYAFEGDRGGMTGGMGSYTMADGSMPFLNNTDIEQADRQMAKVIAALESVTGVPYRGFLYGQFMATHQGVSLIEFNVRLGDPEAINEMALLKCDAVEVFRQIASGNLKPETVIFANQSSLCKYLVPAGYPDEIQSDLLFSLDENRFEQAGFSVRYASVVKDNSHWRTLGSRTLAIVGLGESPGILSEKLESLLVDIEPHVLRHRKDIGSNETLQQKVDHMLMLRADSYHG